MYVVHRKRPKGANKGRGIACTGRSGAIGKGARAEGQVDRLATMTL
jgi:hypothetical protein